MALVEQFSFSQIRQKSVHLASATTNITTNKVSSLGPCGNSQENSNDDARLNSSSQSSKNKEVNKNESEREQASD